MLTWPIIGGIIETLNWLTVTTPSIAASLAYGWRQAAGEDRVVRAVVAVPAFIGLVAVWYVVYRLVGFPLCMRWFA
jgi:hypothetical protein